MKVILKHRMYRIKSGLAASIPELQLTAHGHSPEIAKANLERTILLLLRPFEREGRVEEELQLMGIDFQRDGAELTIDIR